MRCTGHPIVLSSPFLVSLCAAQTPPAADVNDFNKKVKVPFLGAGGIERQSNPNIWNLHEALGKAGVRSVYHVSPGPPHDWLTRRRHLREFAPLLFKD